MLRNLVLCVWRFVSKSTYRIYGQVSHEAMVFSYANEPLAVYLHIKIILSVTIVINTYTSGYAWYKDIKGFAMI